MAVGVIASVVLIGWLLDITLFKSVLPGLVAMNPLTAITFLLSAYALWQFHNTPPSSPRARRGQVAALVVIAIAALTLSDMLFGTQFALDRLLFTEKLDLHPDIPNRMAPNTAVSFLVYGIALVMLDYRSHWPSLGLTMFGGFLALFAIVGYIYNLAAFYGIASYIPMALHTAIAFLVLGLAILFARPDSHLMSVITNDTIAGMTARRLLPAVVLLPIVLGWLLLSGVRRNLYPFEMGAALFTIGLVVAFLVIIWHTARTLLRLETARSTAEARIQNLNDELLAANKELESFSYSVSHDLRAPLRAVSGFSRILLSDYADDLPEDATRYLNLVGANAAQMGRLIDDLLAFSRLSRQAVSQQQVRPGDLARQVFDELHAFDDKREIEFTVRDMPPVEADPALLRQVYVNLVGNALKYTGKREKARIEVGAEAQNGTAVYYVQDNGVGFDMKYANKLFAVFQRLHRSDEFEGTGVGLAIAQRIIHRHGGRIWAEAEVDKGARFLFTIGEGTSENAH